MPKKFVVVIDTQVDFMLANGKLPVAGAEDIIVPGINYLTQLDPTETLGVLFTFDTHGDEYDGSSESEQFPKHCEEGTPGWNNVFNPNLVPETIPVYVLAKGVFNMWEEENLAIAWFEEQHIYERDIFFQAMQKHHPDIVIEIWGVAADFCVKWAIDGFVERKFPVKVVRELTRGIVRTMDEVIEQDFTSANVH